MEFDKYVHYEENDNDDQSFFVDNIHMSNGEYRYMDILRIVCYARSKTLNGQEIIEKFSNFFTNIKREILTEVTNYNRMQRDFGSILLLKDNKTMLEFWLEHKDEKEVLFKIKKEDKNIDTKYRHSCY